MVWLAFSLERQVEKFGAYAGIGAFLGLAVLTLLYFAQARELKRLRDWAGRAPERAQELEERVAAQAEAARQATAAPAPAVSALVPAVGSAPAAATTNGAGHAEPEAPEREPAPAELAAAAFAPAAGHAERLRPPALGGAVAASAVREDEAAPDSDLDAAPAEAPARVVAAPAEAEDAPDAAPETEPERAVAGETAPEVAPAAEAAPSASTPAPDVAPSASEPAPEVTSPAGEPADGDGAGSERDPEAPLPEPAMPAAATPAARRAGGRPAGAPARRPAPAAAPLRATSAASASPRRAGAGAGPRRPVPPRRPAATGGTPLRVLLGAGLLALVVIGAVVFAGTQVFGGGDDDAGTPAGRTAASTTEPVRTASPAPTPGRTRASTRVAVLNGTAVSGLAAEQKAVLSGSGYAGGNVSTGNNTTDQQRAQSEVLYRQGARRQAQDVARLLGIDLTPQPLDAETRALANSGGTGRDADVVVVVGGDKAR
jgi:LytR cell envelope-related transcriptional attenuator